MPYAEQAVNASRGVENGTVVASQQLSFQSIAGMIIAEEHVSCHIILGTIAASHSTRQDWASLLGNRAGQGSLR